jgi:methylmalonyl-CoA/ethylmalonyl-CoA epimerase
MQIRLDHIAVAVADIAAAVDSYEQKLGLHCEKIEAVPDERAKVAFFDLGGAHLELITPLDPEAPLQRSLEKRGEGLHHICLEVEDIERTMAALRDKGVTLVKDKPSIGAGGNKVVFIHPKSMNGVLIELVEKVEKVERR